MALETEARTYERELAGLLSDEGKWVLIHGDEVVGVFETYQDALKIGYERYVLDPFMVKQIESTETIHQFTRDLTLCHM